MQKFHTSYKTQQAILTFSQEEVQQVLSQRTYMDVMAKIDEIKNKKKGGDTSIKTS